VILARVGDDVAFGCENLGVPREEIWPRVHAALDAVRLDVGIDRPTHALSGGQKQRLALAGALAMRPGLLLLDEPTANLDPAGVADVRDAVGRVLDATGATLVVVEHRVDVWLPARGPGDRARGRRPSRRRPPQSVLGARAAELADAGVWVPGIPPAVPPPPAAAAGGTCCAGSWPSRACAACRSRPASISRSAPVRCSRSRAQRRRQVDARAHPRGTAAPGIRRAVGLRAARRRGRAGADRVALT
jgi:energy-coupling factor transport system ATP-binding protein